MKKYKILDETKKWCQKKTNRTEPNSTLRREQERVVAVMIVCVRPTIPGITRVVGVVYNNKGETLQQLGTTLGQLSVVL